MFWKFLAIVLIIILVIIFVKKLRSIITGDSANIKNQSNTTIFHEASLFNYMGEKIIKVYRVLSPVFNFIHDCIPITQNTSHWEVGVKLNNGKHVVISMSKFCYIELYDALYSPKNKIFLLKHNNTVCCGFAVNIYEQNKIKNNNVTLKQLLTLLQEKFTKNMRYTPFGDNCHKMVKYVLKEIFEIDCDEETRTNYNFSSLLKEVKHNNKYLINYGDIVV